MKLKYAITVQRMSVTLTTLLVVVAATAFYVRVIMRDSTVFGNADSLVIVIENGDEVYKSKGVSDNVIRDIRLAEDLNEAYVNIGNVKYSIVRDEPFSPETNKIFPNANIDNFAAANNKKPPNTGIEVIKLTPVINVSKDLGKTLAVSFSAFVLAFIAAGIVASSYNRKHIEGPIEELRNITDSIAEGNLDTPVNSTGCKEIRELYDSVEALRAKLAESVYYREKYDENRKFLISGISHDLRTPVTAICGYIDGILDGVANTEDKVKSYLISARAKADTVKVMIEELLLYSKLDLGQIPFESVKVSAALYLSDVVSEFAPDCEQKGVKLSYSGGIPDGYCISVDITKLTRVMQNIIDNAAKFVPHDGTGKIDVSARVNNSSVIIEIHDNGAGISPEHLPHVFDRFYRGDSARKNDGGSGLGLTIAKQTVEGMGGKIWATSKEGEGTSMLMSFRFIKGVTGDESNTID